MADPFRPCAPTPWPSARYPILRLTLAAGLALTLVDPSVAQHAGHDHHAAHGAAAETTESPERPTVFLDKSPRIVAYQLSRLDNRRLLMVDRGPDDPKYVPVYEAILRRPGMSPQFRQEALEALVSLRDSDPTSVLLDAVAGLDGDDRQTRPTFEQLADWLLASDADSLAAQAGRLESLAVAEDAAATVREVALAALLVGNRADRAWELARERPTATRALLGGIARVPSPDVRGGQRTRVVALLETSPDDAIRAAALAALGQIPTDPGDTFRLAAGYLSDATTREAAVRTMLAVPEEHLDEMLARQVVRELVAAAETTPPEDRTGDAFVDAMQLADRLLPRVPVDQARDYRGRLREVTVRVIRIRTVEEEMRYDVPYFAVEAGRPVQIILENDDLMPHNLVIAVPGALRDVAQAGLNAGPTGGRDGKAYVPESPQVLHATHMVQPHQRERLTFDAPAEPGEYPYVCTFPQHWYRMYGVMVVVDDLDAWSQSPVPPADPIGSDRAFVRAWTVDDFRDDLESGLRGRSPEIGQRLFVEASCQACHQMNAEGGVMGPELTDVFPRWQGDALGVLREILDPSHRIEDQYAMHLVLTVDGQTISGIVTDDGDETVTLLTNPESPDPTVIDRDDIEEMVKSTTSMMPKALLDQYTRDEILEILAYLRDGGQTGQAAPSDAQP